MATKFTTIIISWNTKDYLKKCLESLKPFDAAGINRTLVIDNASSDQSAEMVRQNFPSVDLIENEENLGFARACNQGVEKSDSEFILFLNSDCEIRDPNLFATVEKQFSRDETIGVVGPLVLYPNGRLQSAGQEFTSVKKLIKQQLLFHSAPLFLNKVNVPKEPFEANYVSGSCLFIRKNALDDIGYFDESLVMYTEDMDLCLRAKRSGYKVVVVPGASIIHYKSKSTNKNLSQALRLSIRNNCVFIKNRSGKASAFIAWNIYVIGTLLRVFLAFFRKGASPKSWFSLLLQMPGIWIEINQFKA